MKGLVPAAFVLLIAGCTGQPTASTPSATPVASLPPPTPVASTPSPTPVASTCRLPVIQGSPGQGSGPQTPGFLSIPGGQFTAATDAAGGMAYDAALHVWIPAGERALTPDGLRYVYADHAGQVSTFHIVDLRAKTDRIIGPPGQWVGAGLDDTALYAMRVDFVDSAAYGRLQISRGLWSIPFDGTQPRQLTTGDRSWSWIAAGAAYGDFSTGNVAGSPNDIARLDLKTGQVSSWFDAHARSRIIAVDGQGAAFVLSESGDEELWRVTAANQATKVWSGATDAIRPDGDVAVAGSDVWFSSSSLTRQWAIYHYSPAAGLELLASFTDRPVSVAGPCQ